MSKNSSTALCRCEAAWARGGYPVVKTAALECISIGQGRVTVWDDGQVIVRGDRNDPLQTLHYFPDGRRVSVPWSPARDAGGGISDEIDFPRVKDGPREISL